MGVHVLKHPLKMGESQLTELRMRDHATAADYLAFDVRGGVAQRHALIASLCGTDVAVVAKLHAADYLVLQKAADELINSAEIEAFGPEPTTELSAAEKK